MVKLYYVEKNNSKNEVHKNANQDCRFIRQYCHAACGSVVG
jgi:hypothetical protein